MVYIILYILYVIYYANLPWKYSRQILQPNTPHRYLAIVLLYHLAQNTLATLHLLNCLLTFTLCFIDITLTHNTPHSQSNVVPLT